MWLNVFPIKAKWKGFLLFLPAILLFFLMPYINLNGQKMLMSREEFYRQYVKVCEEKTSKQEVGRSLPWCPCMPKGLVGDNNVSKFVSENQDNQDNVPKQSKDFNLTKPLPVTKGGHWKPKGCQARQSVAIIIPFRNRYPHLAVFEKYIHTFLQRQQLDYSIFVIEQETPEIFNRAAVMDVGYLEALKRRPGGYDCYVFHDVDLLPENDHNMYTCFFSPLHLGAYMNKFAYRMPYKTFFGGAIAMDGHTINATNGFPTHYYGWGGEDDDIWNRVKWQNLTIVRYPPDIGRSYMVYHDADEDNPINPNRNVAYQVSPTLYMQDGLSSIKYETLREKVNPLHTIITINLEKDYISDCVIDPSLPATSPGNHMKCMTKEMVVEGTTDCCSKQGKHYCCNKTGARQTAKTRAKIASIAVIILSVAVITAALVFYKGMPLVKRIYYKNYHHHAFTLIKS